MRSALTANSGFRSSLTVLVGLAAGLVLVGLVPNVLDAQGIGIKRPTNPATPGTAPPITPNFLYPHDGWAITVEDSFPDSFFAPTTVIDSASSANEFFVGERLLKNLVVPPWWDKWAVGLSQLYEFSSQRSRVSPFSLNTNFAGIDVVAAPFSRPYTIFDFSFLYSHGTGSSPGHGSEIVNQYVGSVSLLQPLNWLWQRKWRPADRSTWPVNQQLAILAESAYGAALSSVTIPNAPVQHDTTHPFLQDALLDYQLSWFPCRPVYVKPNYVDPKCNEKYNKDYLDSTEYSYPSLLFELGSGLRFSTLRFDSATSGFSATSSGRQLDYVNFTSLTYSLRCRLGFIVGAEWDAPLSSHPIHGAKSDYANTAIFTGGLVFNLFQRSRVDSRVGNPNRLSVRLLYSYTAFDPTAVTNTVQFQISYLF